MRTTQRPEVPRRPPFVQRTSEGLAKMDVTNTGDIEAILDEEDRWINPLR